jgi:hypothetical protein
MPANESIILGFLDTLIGNPAGDAAALANFQQESNFDPTAYNPGEGAIGLAQWEKGRRTGPTGLQAYAAAHGGKETDLAMQLGYLGQELTGPYSSVLSYLRGAKDPGAAAAYFDQNFEGSSGSTRNNRISYAETIYQQIQNGTLTPSNAPAGTPAAPAGGAPPFTPANLPQNGNLTADQRRQMIAWMVTRGGDGAKLAKVGGKQLLAIYTGMWVMWKFLSQGVTGPGGSSNPFNFDWVKTLVIKGVFTIAGLGMTVLGMYAAAQPVGQGAAA